MLINQTTSDTLATQIVLCNTFWRKFKGLMFKRALPADCAYVFIYGRESIADASIHMFFVPFSIAVIWLDAHKCVVDTAVARPWRPYYAPKRAAQYFVEGAPELLDRVKLGDILDF
ncbi:MAG: DUF192 domain-containing protein [Anaerolineae bacterium]|nr:DUF192 domain-containing protein [Anaerolineae bacterium]